MVKESCVLPFMLQRIVVLVECFVNVQRHEGLLYVIASEDNNRILSDFSLSS